MSKHVVILGGGLAGLACGYELQKNGQQVTVLEREPHVGGMASSFVEGGGADGAEYWCHDFGPHRFHTQDENLIRHVQEILGDNI
ncbi:MAG: FAD-dependent oxidoreductase, partial [Planctomycetota bacterium]